MTDKLRSTTRGKAAIASVMAVAVGGMVTLFVGQAPVHDDVALAVKYLVQPWEGRTLVAYLDKIAKPPVWTICDGDTTNVGPGTVETQNGCNKRVTVKMERDYRPFLAKCVPTFNNEPIAWRGMMDSLSWNIGVGAACSSTAARIVRDARATGKQPDFVASCQAATAFDKAGGRVIVGLAKRRGMGDVTRAGEGEICRSGV